jgi:hypothetical protein
MAVKDHLHDWFAKSYPDGGWAVACKSCDLRGLVGAQAEVEKAVSTALLVRQATKKHQPLVKRIFGR